MSRLFLAYFYYQFKIYLKVKWPDSAPFCPYKLHHFHLILKSSTILYERTLFLNYYGLPAHN
jgi:hypothetical protein